MVEATGGVEVAAGTNIVIDVLAWSEPPVLPEALTEKGYVPVATPVVFQEKTPVEELIIEFKGVPEERAYSIVPLGSESVALAVKLTTVPLTTVELGIDDRVTVGVIGVDVGVVEVVFVPLPITVTMPEVTVEETSLASLAENKTLSAVMG